jgi:hypothetical protein
MEGKERMKVLKKTVPLWAVIVALVAVSGVAIAAVVISQQINTQIQILASYGMEVYDTDGTTLLTSVDFGSAYRDDNFFTPTDSIYYYIKNTGEADIWVSFSVTDPVSDVTIQVHTVSALRKLYANNNVQRSRHLYRIGTQNATTTIFPLFFQSQTQKEAVGNPYPTGLEQNWTENQQSARSIQKGSTVKRLRGFA